MCVVSLVVSTTFDTSTTSRSVRRPTDPSCVVHGDRIPSRRRCNVQHAWFLPTKHGPSARLPSHVRAEDAKHVASMPPQRASSWSTPHGRSLGSKGGQTSNRKEKKCPIRRERGSGSNLGGGGGPIGPGVWKQAGEGRRETKEGRGRRMQGKWSPFFPRAWVEGGVAASCPAVVAATTASTSIQTHEQMHASASCGRAKRTKAWDRSPAWKGRVQADAANTAGVNHRYSVYEMDGCEIVCIRVQLWWRGNATCVRNPAPTGIKGACSASTWLPNQHPARILRSPVWEWCASAPSSSAERESNLVSKPLPPAPAEALGWLPDATLSSCSCSSATPYVPASAP